MNFSPNTERTRLARELHDGLAQELAAFGYRLDQVIGDDNLSNSNRLTLRELRLSLSSLINQVRDEIYDLRSEKGKNFQLQLSEQMQTLLSGSEISYEITGSCTVAPDHKFELLRATRELALNAKRHSNCSSITITLRPDLIILSDNGHGGVGSGDKSFGINGVSERLELIGASMQISSTSSGTTISIFLK